jgi:hypothetical protein
MAQMTQHISTLHGDDGQNMSACCIVMTAKTPTFGTFPSHLDVRIYRLFPHTGRVLQTDWCACVCMRMNACMYNAHTDLYTKFTTECMISVC